MKIKNNYLLIAFLLACTFSLSFNSFLIESYAYEIERTGTVYNIVDGDTIDITSFGRIRPTISHLSYIKKRSIYVDGVYGTDSYGHIVAVV
jgi:hypothetical protein